MDVVLKMDNDTKATWVLFSIGVFNILAATMFSNTLFVAVVFAINALVFFASAYTTCAKK